MDILAEGRCHPTCGLTVPLPAGLSGLTGQELKKGDWLVCYGNLVNRL